MAEIDSLNQRIRDGLLLDSYGALLTERQRRACGLILIDDLSLAEAASALGVSRQGVHDLIARSREHMEALDSSLGLVKKNAALDEISRLLAEYGDRLPRDFHGKVMEALGD